MIKISFEDIGAAVASFAADDGVLGGQVVKLTDNGTVGPCAAGDGFCGLAMEPRGGSAAVQVKGFLTVNTADSLSLGWATLAADGQGGVKAAASGVNALVVSVGEDGTAVLCL